MKTLVRVLIVLPLALVIIVLAVANRAPVQVSLDPFSGVAPLVAFSAPLFAIVLAAAALGVILGGVAVWWSQGRHRRVARLQAREIERIRAEAERRRRAEGAPVSGAPVPSPAGGAIALPARTNVY